MSKLDIKIFVSHRIDQESTILDNPIYVNVRCGAVYDKRSPELINGILGDDTGDNISEKRESFCELTVLYWAWKNCEADYYGLCHYRRYMSFADKSYIQKNNRLGFLKEEELNNSSIKKYKLNDEAYIQRLISDFDIITTPCEDVYYANDGQYKSVYELCKGRKRDFDIKGVDAFIRVFKKEYPEYENDIDTYFSDHYAKFYNCFVMKKELFDEFCSILFDVLFKLEKELDTSYYNKWTQRMPAFMSEHAFGIFCLHKKRLKKIRFCQKDLVLFNNSKSNVRLQLEPVYKSNNVTVVISSSDYFAPYAGVYLKSLIDCSSTGNNYDIIVFEKAMSDLNKESIKQLADGKENISIRFYNPKGFFEGTKLQLSSDALSEETFYRILTPYILEKYDKAIVTDCDMIAKKDIADLYNVDLEGMSIAAAKDVVMQGYLNGTKDAEEYCRNTLYMDNPYNYVNTGVVVFDLKKIRTEVSMEEMLGIAQRRRYNIQEQDILNLVFYNKIKFLDISWNMYTKVNPSIEEAIYECAPLKSVKEYAEAHKHPFLIHWASLPKPWQVPMVDYGYEWWDVAIKSPFIGEFISRFAHHSDEILIDSKNRIEELNSRTRGRRIVDFVFPPKSKSREVVKRIIPQGSRRWKFFKRIIP